MTYQSRKESILNCLLEKGHHFINKRVQEELRAKAKRVKLLALKNNKVWDYDLSLFGNDPKYEGMRNNNGSLF